MMEATRSPRRGNADEAQADLAPLELETSADRLLAFPSLVKALAEAPPERRASIADELNELLIAMRTPGHEAEESELVLEALESEVFVHQLDRTGRSCRKEAVETVMACGFPHALLLDAEDVKFASEFRRATPTVDEAAATSWERRAQSARSKGALVIAAGQVASACLCLREASLPLLAVLTSIWLASIAAAAVFAFRRPRELNVGALGAAITIVMIAGASAAVSAHSWAVALGPASLGLGLYVGIMHLFEPRADPPKPGDWNFQNNDSAI